MSGWVFHYLRDHSAYCVLKTSSEGTGDDLLVSLHITNDKALPYFANRVNQSDECAKKIEHVEDFSIEPFHSQIKRPKNGEKFYEYPDRL